MIICCQCRFRIRAFIFLLISIECLSTQLFAITFCQIGPTPSADVATEKKPEVAKISEVKLMLERIGDRESVYRAVGNLGDISAGKDYEIELSVVNPFADDIQFSDVVMSCACTEVKFPQKMFKANSTTTGELKYHAPSFSKKGLVVLGLSIQNGPGSKGHVASFEIHGKLLGIIDLGDANHTFEVARDKLEYSIPVFITPPVVADTLSVTVSKELRDVVASIERDNDENVFIKLLIPPTALPEKGISGEVVVKYEPSGVTKTVVASFVPQWPIVISPSFLTFSKVEHDDVNLVANAIIQIRDLEKNDQQLDDKEKNEAVKSPMHVNEVEIEHLEIECSFGGRAVTVNSAKMARRIFRLQFKIPLELLKRNKNEKDDVEKKSNIIICRVKAGSKTYELDVPFSF